MTVPAATCFDCDYDLRGLPPDARCPECGLAVAESAERFERLGVCGAVAPVRRGTGWVGVALVVGFGALLVYAAIGLAANYIRLRPTTYFFLLPLIAAAATLLMAAALWFAARALRRVRPPGERAAGRLLTVAAWVIFPAAAAMWVLGWFADAVPDFGGDALGDAAMATAGLLLAASCGLYAPAFAWVLYNRVRLWPQAGALPRLLRLVTLVMLVGLALGLPALVVVLVDAVGNRPVTFRGPRLYNRVYLADLMQMAAGVGWLAYGLSVPAALLLISSAFGRVGKLAERLNVPPAEEVGQERQLAAVVPQGVEVERD